MKKNIKNRYSYPNNWNEILEHIPSVKCVVCKMLHEASSIEYLIIKGNVSIGKDCEIVKDNLDKENNLQKVTIVCNNIMCLKELFKTKDKESNLQKYFEEYFKKTKDYYTPIPTTPLYPTYPNEPFSPRSYPDEWTVTRRDIIS